ncbi:MAG: hypothetical protein RQ733_14080, partial [Methyloprofundus sp.]|nr:hypothetical protein [Methyloprofundus sp.]
AINVNAMPMQPEVPFIGINPVRGMCHIEAADGEFSYMGAAEVKFTENKNFMIATCKAEYEVDKDMPIDIQGREGSCRIGIPGKGPTEGIGGFTVSQGGVVTGRCKVEKTQ